MDQKRGHFREGAAADPDPPGGALVAGGRGRGAAPHHLLRLPAHPQPPLPQAHLSVPPGRGRQEGAAGFSGGLERGLQNERGPAEQRQRLRGLRAAVLQVPGSGKALQLHPAGHAPAQEAHVQGALSLPAGPVTPPQNPGDPPSPTPTLGLPLPVPQNPVKTPQKLSLWFVLKGLKDPTPGKLPPKHPQISP